MLKKKKIEHFTIFIITWWKVFKCVNEVYKEIILSSESLIFTCMTFYLQERLQCNGIVCNFVSSNLIAMLSWTKTLIFFCFPWKLLHLMWKNYAKRKVFFSNDSRMLMVCYHLGLKYKKFDEIWQFFWIFFSSLHNKKNNMRENNNNLS